MFALNADQLAVREHGKAFADERIAPNAVAWDETQAFPGRCAARSRGARNGGDLCARGKRRLGADPPRRRADLRSAGDRLPEHRGLSVDPQHGRLDGRPLRLAGTARAIHAEARQHGASGELLPDRARRRLRRGGAEDARAARRRFFLCPRRRQAIHLRRRRGGRLSRDGAHRRRGRRRRFRFRRREGQRPACRSAPTSARWAGTPSRRAR